MRTTDLLLLPMQIFVTAAGVAALAVWPPAAGAMLLVPMSADANATARAGAAAGALLLGAGPLPGSIVVFGDRRRIARQFGFGRVVIVAAPASACGPPAPSART